VDEENLILWISPSNFTACENKKYMVKTLVLFPFMGSRSCNIRIMHGKKLRSRYSDWLRAGRPRGRSSSLGRVMNFLLSTTSRPTLGSTQPPIQWVLGALSPGVQRPRREADHSSPASAEVKKMRIYTSAPPYAFMA
jgi:hypothetical protein